MTIQSRSAPFSTSETIAGGFCVAAAPAVAIATTAATATAVRVAADVVAAGLAMAVTLLLGALYSPLVAFSLASALSAIGPSLSYFLFKAAGKPLVVCVDAFVVAVAAYYAFAESQR